MTVRFTLMSSAAVLIAIAACSDGADPTSAKEHVVPQPDHAGVVASATGSGHVQREDGSIRKFTINAVQLADGTVSGHYDLKVVPLQFLKDDGFTPPLLSFSGTITCMTVIGNSAYLGGVVNSHQNGELFFGRDDFTGVAIELIDNGEGLGVEPDQISSVFVYFPEDPTTPQDYCDAPAPGPVFPISAGNITVQ